MFFMGTAALYPIVWSGASLFLWNKSWKKKKASVVFDLAALFGFYVVFLFYVAYIHNSVKNLKTKIQYEVLELTF